MAMTTWIQMVSADEIRALKAKPETINQLDQPDDQSTFTQLQQTSSYFLCGDAYPDADEHGALAAALNGYEIVEASTLETGVFQLVYPKQTKGVADALFAVDIDAITEAVGEADLWSLVAEEELYDVESLLADGEDIPARVAREIANLHEFYAEAAERGLGVAIYTS